jgi:hypothetical protein
MAVANCTLLSIDPNPDISGIGVRTAIYAQAILTLVQPVLAALDKFISEEELASLHMLYLGILMPGCALLLSAVIQTSTSGLSVYHATIVLNLSWINNTSALIFFQFALIAEMKLKKGREFRRKVGELLDYFTKSLKEDEGGRAFALEGVGRMRFALQNALKKEPKKVDGSRDVLQDVIQGLAALILAAPQPSELEEAVQAMTERLQDARFRRALGLETRLEGQSTHGGRLSRWKALSERWVRNRIERIPGGANLVYLLERDFVMATVTVLHLTLFSAYGTWFWFTIAQRNDYCDQLTTHGILFASIPVTSKPLRIVTIIFYTICTIPFVNVLIFGCLELIVIYLIYRLQWWFRSPVRSDSKKNGPHNLGDFLGESSESDSGTVLYSFIGLTLVIQIYFIVSTELTIRFNAHLLAENQGANEENEWTFGQTLAVALIVVPLIQVWKDARKTENQEVYKRWWRKLKIWLESVLQRISLRRGSSGAESEQRTEIEMGNLGNV